MLSVYLVPIGRSRFELYSEPPEDSSSADSHAGFFQQRIHRFRDGWRELVHTARSHQSSPRRLAAWRDWAVCRVAEMIAEQRTLWAIRNAASVGFSYPSDLSESAAETHRDRMLADARRHHGLWTIIDGVLLIAAVPFTLIPGPNLFAYYFGIRLLSHYLSWRGAGHGIDRVQWQPRAEPALAELGGLVDVPREARASRVAAIADALRLPRLAAFFDRAAVSAR
jgi:pimeloyl-ACP methyl ester carboxylesterase